MLAQLDHLSLIAGYVDSVGIGMRYALLGGSPPGTQMQSLLSYHEGRTLTQALPLVTARRGTTLLSRHGQQRAGLEAEEPVGNARRANRFLSVESETSWRGQSCPIRHLIFAGKLSSSGNLPLSKLN